jgi:hypothetical protein
MTSNMDLPTCFCWTRFGTEAGQSIEHIFRRKNEERAANKGIFLWGIGNSIGMAINELVRRCENPEILFSPIKSQAKTVDAAPESVVAWTKAQTFDGEEFTLPMHSLVTSRHDTSSPKHTHYALVCLSDNPLTPSEHPLTFSFRALRNIVSGNPVGASQVTAVVTLHSNAALEGSLYDVSLRANLVRPYFVRLREPRRIPELTESTQDWAAAVQSAWQERMNFA